MLNHSSAQQREETHHTLTSTKNNLNGRSKNVISDALRHRAQSLIDDTSIDASTRVVIRYGLETDDPWLSEMVRRVEAGEPIFDTTVPQTPEHDSVSITEKAEMLAEMICRTDDDPATRSAALLVLMATLENSTHPRALANHVKHMAFTRCGELNSYGLVDTHIAVLEGKLIATYTELA